MKTLTKITIISLFVISCSIANANITNKAKALVDIVNLASKQALQCEEIIDILNIANNSLCKDYAIVIDENYEMFVDEIINKYEQVEDLRSEIEKFYKKEGKKYQTLKNVISSLKRIKLSDETFSRDLQNDLKAEICSEKIKFLNPKIHEFKTSICNNTYTTIVDDFLDNQLSLVETELYNQINRLDEHKLFSGFDCSLGDNIENKVCSDEYINNLKIRYENTRLLIFDIASNLYQTDNERIYCQISAGWQQFELVDECLDGIKANWQGLINPVKTKIANTILVHVFSESRPPFTYNSIFELVASKYGYCKENNGQLDCTKAFGWINEFSNLGFANFNNLTDEDKKDIFSKITQTLKPIILAPESSCIVAYPNIVEISKKEEQVRKIITSITWEVYQDSLSNGECNPRVKSNKQFPLGIIFKVNAGDLTLPFNDDGVNEEISVSFNHLQFFAWLKNTQIKVLPPKLIKSLTKIESQVKNYIDITDDKFTIQPFEAINLKIEINKTTGGITNNFPCNSLSNCPELTTKVNNLINKNIVNLIPPPFCLKDNLDLSWCDGFNDDIKLGKLNNERTITLDNPKEINIIGIGTAQFKSAQITIKNGLFSIEAKIEDLKLNGLDLNLGKGTMVLKTAQGLTIEFDKNNKSIQNWLEKKLSYKLKNTRLNYTNDSLIFGFNIKGNNYNLNLSKNIEDQLAKILINQSKDYAQNWFSEFLNGQTSKKTQIADFKLDKTCNNNDVNCTLVISSISTNCTIIEATINKDGRLSKQDNSSNCFDKWLNNNLDKIPSQISQSVITTYADGLDIAFNIASNLVTATINVKLQFQPKYKMIVSYESNIEQQLDDLKSDLINKICQEINNTIQIKKHGESNNVTCDSLNVNDEIDLSFNSISVEKVRLTKNGLDFSNAYIDSEEINNLLKNSVGESIIFGKVKFNFEKDSVVVNVPIQVELKDILTTSWMFVKIKIDKNGFEIVTPKIKPVIYSMVTGKLNEMVKDSNLEINLLGRTISFTDLKSSDETIELSIKDKETDAAFAKLKWSIDQGLQFENSLTCGAVNIVISEAINKVDFSSFDSFISLGAPVINCDKNSANIPVFFKFTGYPQITIGNMTVDENGGTQFTFTNDIQIPVGGPYIIGPVTLNNNLVTANIDEKTLKLFSDISLLRLDELVKIDGNLTWDFDKNTIESKGPLIIANMFNVQNSSTLIRYKKKGNKRKGITISVDSSDSPLKDIFSLTGCLFTGENDCKTLNNDINLKNCNQKLLDGKGLGNHDLLLGCGEVKIFKGLLKADVNLELTNDKITLNANLDLPVVKDAKIKFISDLLLLNPQISGSTSLDLGITKASISFSQSKTSASILANAFGISVGFVTPDLKKFDWNMLEDLLKKMLRLDIKDIKDAVKAIISGNFEINPASRFGRKSKGGGSGGKGKSGGIKGSNGKVGNSTSGGDFVSGYQQGYTQVKNGIKTNNKPVKTPTAFDQGLREGAREAKNKAASVLSKGSPPIVPPGDAFYEFKFIDGKCKYKIYKKEKNKEIVISDKINLEGITNTECNNNIIAPIGSSLLFSYGSKQYAIIIKNYTDIKIFNKFRMVSSITLNNLKMNRDTHKLIKQAIVSLWASCINQNNGCKFNVSLNGDVYKTKVVIPNRNKVYWNYLSIDNNELKRKSIIEYRSQMTNTPASCLDKPSIENSLQNGSVVITVFDNNSQSSAFVINNLNVDLYKDCSDKISFKSKKPLINWLSSKMCSGYSRYLDLNQIIQPLEYLVKNNIALAGKKIESIGTDGLLLSNSNQFTPISTKNKTCKKNNLNQGKFIDLIKSSLIDKSKISNIGDALDVFEQRIFDKNSWEMCMPKKDFLNELCITNKN